MRRTLTLMKKLCIGCKNYDSLNETCKKFPISDIITGNPIYNKALMMRMDDSKCELEGKEHVCNLDNIKNELMLNNLKNIKYKRMIALSSLQIITLPIFFMIPSNNFSDLYFVITFFNFTFLCFTYNDLKDISRERKSISDKIRKIEKNME